MITTENQGNVHIVGGGLAGSEAAWQALRRGLKVTLYEMRPTRSTPAHQSGDLAELVCSNTFKSLVPTSAPGQLKSEMTRLDSLIVRAAHESRIPAGQALGVDRVKFAQNVTAALAAEPNFTRLDLEVSAIPDNETLERRGDCWIIATGPLTSEAMMPVLEKLCGQKKENLYFYDAISPIIATDSIDMEHAFFANRYQDGADDYLNLPLSKAQYESFIDDVMAAEKAPLHEFETTSYFEACLPIEVMAERGRETLRFGPMKPVGLRDPRGGDHPWAVIQLRRENAHGTMYSMVGFQTKMKWGEQQRVFTKIPALKNAEFFRFGSVHRNTYLESPKVLSSDLSFRTAPRVFLAGQITGVEGYTESSAIGLLAGRAAAARIHGEAAALPPENSMIGALAHYVTKGGAGKFQPMNANLGLLAPIGKIKGLSRAERRNQQCLGAERSFHSWFAGAAP